MDSIDMFSALQVMVVDDDRIFRKYLEAQLEMLGVQVIAVENGELAWTKIQSKAPDLVLTDIFMPGLSGIELCRRIKASRELRGIPVVLLTMLGPKAKDEGYQAGADDFLNKPPHLQELKTRLRNLLLLKSLQGSLEAQPLGSERPPASSAHILVLESYGVLRSHIQHVLAQEGWHAEGLDSQAALFDRLKAGRPDLLILDQDLLEGPGSALVARLRSGLATSQLSILLISEPGALETGSVQGECDEHLLKPFEDLELITRVRALLRHDALKRGTDAHRLDADPSALRDPLSGAYTQAFLHASLTPVCAFASLVGQPVGLLAVRFQSARFTAGEERHLALAIQSRFAPQDTLCRVKEDIFVAILPGSSLSSIQSRVEELRTLLPPARFALVSGREDGLHLLHQLWKQLF